MLTKLYKTHSKTCNCESCRLYQPFFASLIANQHQFWFCLIPSQIWEFNKVRLKENLEFKVSFIAIKILSSSIKFEIIIRVSRYRHSELVIEWKILWNFTTRMKRVFYCLFEHQGSSLIPFSKPLQWSNFVFAEAARFLAVSYISMTRSTKLHNSCR